MIIRQHTPGPFHDCLAHDFARYVTLPQPVREHYFHKRYGLSIPEAAQIAAWVITATRGPCPVP